MTDKKEPMDLAAEATECERRAAAGEQPENLWREGVDLLGRQRWRMVGFNGAIHVTCHERRWYNSLTNDVTCKTFLAAMILTEALLRKAARPLFAAELDALRARVAELEAEVETLYLLRKALSCEFDNLRLGRAADPAWLVERLSFIANPLPTPTPEDLNND